ncbi:MAG TPA: TolC family protein [Methylococcus sp.]|nr:TolC family protein [Methylococcus sp.]
MSCARPSVVCLHIALSGLSGCAYYFDTAPHPAITRHVEERLQSGEGLPLAPLSKTPPESVEQALPKFTLRRGWTERPLPPEKPDTPPAPKVPAEDSKPLSIAEARALALANNLDLKIALIEPKIAATAVSEEEAKFDDLIFVRTKYADRHLPPEMTEIDSFKLLDPTSPVQEFTALRIDAEQVKKSLEFDVGIAIPLRTGGKVTLSAPFDERNVSKKGFQAEQYRAALRFSISQPLLRDGGIDTNVAGIRIARYEQRAVDVKTRLQAIRVLAAVERAYWSLYSAWGELDVRRQQYENAADNLEMVRKRVAEGLTAKIEITRAEIGVAERLEALIVAETMLKLRQRQLKLLLNDPGLDLDSPVVLIPQTRPTLLHFDFDRERLVQRALAGRLELLELELKLGADLTKIDYLRNQTLPMFMLDYSYGTPGQSPSSFDGAFDQAFGWNFSDWSVGLRMEIPVTNELRRARLERVVLERLQRLTTRQLRELSVRREIYDALDQVEQNWQRILAARQNVLLAGLNYDAEIKQFREGLGTMTEVLTALTRLGEVQSREVRTITDYQISLIDLAFATGTTLGYSRMGLSPVASASFVAPSTSAETRSD